jgi:16S rRNA (cytidine1402-2'-O)-methyltransferase
MGKTEPVGGTLYIVATPIGNREDITVRALRVLREVAVVAAEDTRHTGQLLAHYDIRARYLSLHAHNEHARVEAILGRLAAGEDVALVSDAGTPLIADPGARLVHEVRTAGYAVVPVPGPSALLAAVAASGMVPGPFTFIGFLPAKQAARHAALAAIGDLPHPIVCYEAPHRLRAMLADAREVLGERQCTLCRELTKLHEEIIEGTFSEHLAALEDRPARGEYVVIIAAAVPVPHESDEQTIETMLRALLSSGYTPAAAAKEVAAETGVDRAACYHHAIAMKGNVEI